MECLRTTTTVALERVGCHVQLFRRRSSLPGARISRLARDIRRISVGRIRSSAAGNSRVSTTTLRVARFISIPRASARRVASDSIRPDVLGTADNLSNGGIRHRRLERSDAMAQAGSIRKRSHQPQWRSTSGGNGAQKPELPVQSEVFERNPSRVEGVQLRSTRKPTSGLA